MTHAAAHRSHRPRQQYRQVVHDLGLGLTGGGDEDLRISPREWTDLTVENRRAEADGYFLSCTAPSMIDAIEDVERRLAITEPVTGVGRLFSAEPTA